MHMETYGDGGKLISKRKLEFDIRQCSASVLRRKKIGAAQRKLSKMAFQRRMHSTKVEETQIIVSGRHSFYSNCARTKIPNNASIFEHF